MYKVLDLFSGIGGFSLGLEATGEFETTAFCEIDVTASLVLRKHWPTVKIFKDIRALRGEDVGTVDVICGGFPCQDIATCGRQAGITGKRSGLWKEFKRLIGEIKPRYAIIENVANLRSTGLATVLQDLWQIGYDAEWHIIPACSVGSPHKRERIFIIAYDNRLRVEGPGAKLKATGFNKRPWRDWPGTQPKSRRVDDGDSPRSHKARIEQIGNSVVPKIVQTIGEGILAF